MPSPRTPRFRQREPQSAAVPCAQSHGFSPSAVDPARTWPRILPAPREHGSVRLIRRVEEEPVWPGPKNCRQRFQCTCYRKANAANCVDAVGYPGVLHAAFISMIRGVNRLGGYIGGDERAFGKLPHEPEFFDPSGAGFRRGGARIRAAPTHSARRGEPRAETEPAGDPRQPGRGAKRTGAAGGPLRAFAASERERRRGGPSPQRGSDAGDFISGPTPARRTLPDVPGGRGLRGAGLRFDAVAAVPLRTAWRGRQPRPGTHGSGRSEENNSEL